MDETQLADFERTLSGRLEEIYGDKPWLIGSDILQVALGGVELVTSLGASDAMAVACRTGVGEMDESLRHVISNDSRVPEDADIVTRIHDAARQLHDLPEEVVAEIDDWDPERRARVIVDFTIYGGPVAGRQTFGAKRPEWEALEDKIVIRDVWQHAGVEMAEDRVVEVADRSSVLAAHEELGSSRGTVWAVDNDQGWHGGGKGTYWVPTVKRANELLDQLEGKHRQIRIQPFLEGVPCSIHGMVLPDYTIALRPCEMLVLLDETKHAFEYMRAATFWDPEPAAANAMRQAVRSTGDALRELHDFGGVFTLDGVLTASGFVPTEVNPRFGAALPMRLPTVDGGTISIFFVHLAVVEGELGDIEPERLEEWLLHRLNSARSGSVMFATPTPPPGEEEITADLCGTWVDGQVSDVHLADEGDEEAKPFVNLVWGPHVGSGFAFATFTDQVPVGPPVAPTAVKILKFVADNWDVDMPAYTLPFEP